MQPKHAKECQRAPIAHNSEQKPAKVCGSTGKCAKACKIMTVRVRVKREIAEMHLKTTFSYLFENLVATFRHPLENFLTTFPHFFENF